MSTSHIYPRRRSAALHQINPKPCQPALPEVMPLLKGATFHSPKSPAGSDDPILDIPSLPRRSPTCPQTLEELVYETDNRITNVLATIQRSLDTNSVVGNLSDKDECPVPRFLIAHAATNLDPMDVDDSYAVTKHQASKHASAAAGGQANHHHASDSGLGSSVSSHDNVDTPLRLMTPSQRNRSSVYSSTNSYRTAINKSAGAATAAAADGQTTGLHLSDHATKKIKEYIIDPILAQEKLRDYHNLVGSLPQRIGDRAITCLRDLEKTLIFLAPVNAKSAASYLNFCETSIQCIHTTVDHLNDRDLRRPTDRPYTNNYFVDLTHQIRQYAQIMAASKKKLAQGQPLDKEDYVTGENLRMFGGNGKPVELMREKNGEFIPIDAGKSRLPAEDFMMDDAERAMARKRKCDIGKVEWRACRECGKQFTRPCDLTKHEKTHSRPWKCPDEGCKYYEFGWPTEKERERHFNDKHISTPALYHCEFTGCAYTSKRESNCKQHMEKAHGWNYIRSKSKKGQKLMPTTQQTPPESVMPTPGSAFGSMSTPMSDFSASPLPSTSYAFSPTGSMDTGSNNGSASIQGSNGMNFDFNAQSEQGFDFSGFTSAPLFPTQPLSPEASEGRRESVDNIGAGMTFDFDGPIDFNDPAFTVNCPPPQDFLDQFYNQAQQPTPAMSDFETDFLAGKPGMTMQGGDLTLTSGNFDDMDMFQTSELPCQPQPVRAGLDAADWDLFGPNGESSQMAQMLPDFGFGNQFSNQDLYIDSSDDEGPVSAV